MQLDLDNFYESVIRLSKYKSKKNLERHLKYIFGVYDFSNKSILDIGGGLGLLSIYAAIKGSNATCLEPEASGSTNGIQNKFNLLSSNLKCKNNISFHSCTFQDFKHKNNSFDLIVIANAINHLNENACINLLKRKSSELEYDFIFQKMAKLLKNNGKLIITDCSSSNFFNDIRLKNPLMPSIEWHKHQSPEIWSQLLRQNGFLNPEVTWSSFNSLGKFGRILMNNKFINYMTLSHFRLETTLDSIS